MKRNTIYAGIGMAIAVFALFVGWAVMDRVGFRAEAPSGTMVNLLDRGLGVDPRNIRFSWVCKGEGDDGIQSASRIIVSSSLQASLSGIGDVWDSGKQPGSQSVAVPYVGPLLDRMRVYYWRVQTWNTADEDSEFSEPMRMVVAPGKPWPGEWVGLPEADRHTPFYARKDFVLADRRIEDAFVFVALESEYRLCVNGELAGFSTGGSRYVPGTMIFKTFDITGLLAEDAVNCLSLQGRGKCLTSVVLVNFADGGRMVFCSDETWKIMDASDIYRNSMNGVSGKCGGAGTNCVTIAFYEHIFAPAIPEGWMLAGFDDSGWEDAVEKQCSVRLVSSPKNPLVEETVKPVVMEKTEEDTWFFDFGKEMLGSLVLNPHGMDEGDVEVRLGEELDADGHVMHHMRTDVDYREWWTLDKTDRQLSNLGLRAFRYAELKGAMSFDPNNVAARAVHIAFDDSQSDFTSSSPRLNRMWGLSKYTSKALSVDMWTDSEARERVAYAGDYYPAQLSYYAVQREYSLPRYSLVYSLYNPSWPTSYAGLTLVMFWRDYMYTGNAEALRMNYDKLKTLTRENEMNSDNLVEQKGELWKDTLDWPDAGPGVPAEEDGLVKCRIGAGQNAVAYAGLVAMSKIADVLGMDGDSDFYREKAALLREAINRHLWDDERGCYIDGLGTDHAAMHSTAYPAALDVSMPEMRSKIVRFLERKGQVGGVFGAQFYYDALYELGAGDVAWRELTREDSVRNWLHMLELGATTTTEAWDPALKENMTWSHLWGNAIGNIIACRIMGIRPLEPGFGRVEIRPQPGRLKRAVAVIPTIRGAVSMRVRNSENGVLELSVVLPSNTSADVFLPQLKSGEWDVLLDDEPTEVVADGLFVGIRGVEPGLHRVSLVQGGGR